MSRDEIDHLLGRLFRRRAEPAAPPTKEDWDDLRAKFGCDFSQKFMDFMELVPNYWFEGELYTVAVDCRSAGDASIAQVFDAEVEMEAQGGLAWDADLIPFYGVGNGDYWCLSAKLGEASAVYYVYHEDGHAEKETTDFSDWLLSLPELFAETPAPVLTDRSE